MVIICSKCYTLKTEQAYDGFELLCNRPKCTACYKLDKLEAPSDDGIADTPAEE